jgi:hypothetical protein
VTRLSNLIRVPIVRALLGLLAFAALALSLQAEDDVANEFRQTVVLNYPIKGKLTGLTDFEYRDNPEKDYQAYGVLWPGLTYSARPRLQLTAGLITLYTDNGHSADKLELRPYAGVKYFTKNKRKWNIYNYTRYEYRDTENRETGVWTAYSRLRSRFGVEFPLTSLASAWKPKTWYGLGDVEPIYRFDQDKVGPVYVRAGFGYILHNQARVELIYWAQFARDSAGEPKDIANIIQLQFKIGLTEGILERIRNPRADQ